MQLILIRFFSRICNITSNSSANQKNNATKILRIFIYTDTVNTPNNSTSIQRNPPYTSQFLKTEISQMNPRNDDRLTFVQIRFAIFKNKTAINQTVDYAIR